MRISIKKHGFTQVSHTVFDLIIPTLTLTEQSIFLRIYRQTVGWNKPSDKISTSQFKKFTGIIDHKPIDRAIKNLELSKLITVIRIKGKTNEYEINWTNISEMYPNNSD